MDVQIRKIAWGAPKNIIAYHSTKIGGWSKGAFASSNMSLDVGDNPKDVQKNRDSIIKQLELISKPVFMKQIHSATVRAAKSSSDNLVCDSCYTTTKGLPLAVLSADCLPILISSNDGDKIGVIHAGWRGLASGIIQKFIKIFSTPSCFRMILATYFRSKCHAPTSFVREKNFVDILDNLLNTSSRIM